MGILKSGSVEKQFSPIPLTIGTVVDTNDPAQMGRIRVQCPAYGDPVVIDEAVERDQIPWATYVTPFGGTTNNIKRGPNDQPAADRASYGMWAIPKLGAQVICCAIDNNPNLRVWMGCVYPNSSPHSLPHGRYLNGTAIPSGSSEKAIDPLATNMAKSFGTDPNKFEWRSRAADYSVSAVDAGLIREGELYTESTIPDDKDVEYKITGDTTIKGRQGYAVNRAVALDGLEHPLTGDVAYDSTVYSWTTPGFHSMSMDDRPENCRFKIRTTRGHQIIMDDTNERVYINTAEGNNWIEMDQNGNIDVYSSRRISFHSVKEINFTTDETFRVKAKKGIHLMSDDQIRIHSKKNDIHIRSDKNIRTHALKSIFEQADNDMHRITLNGSMYTTSGDAIEFTSTTDTLLTANANIHSKAIKSIYSQTGEDISSQAAGNIYLTATKRVEVLASETLTLQSGGNMHINSLDSLLLTASTSVHVKSSRHIFLDATLNTSILSGEKILVTGKEVHQKADVNMWIQAPVLDNMVALTKVIPGITSTGASPAISAVTAGKASDAIPAPPADSAILAQPPEEKQAFWTARVPEHEPWNRVMMKIDEADKDADNKHVPEYGYDDGAVGKVDRGTLTRRNPFWHR